MDRGFGMEEEKRALMGQPSEGIRWLNSVVGERTIQAAIFGLWDLKDLGWSGLGIR